MGGVYQKDILYFYCKRQAINHDKSALFDNIKLLSERQRLEIFLKSAQDAGIPLKEMDIDYLQRSYKVLNITDSIELMYIPKNRSERLVFFSAEQNNWPLDKRDDQPTLMKILNSQSEIKDSLQESPDSLGWEKYCNNIKIHKIPGSHFSMLKPPHVKILADKIKLYF